MSARGDGISTKAAVAFRLPRGAASIGVYPSTLAPPTCGLSDRLPVGFQVIGRAFDEPTVLGVADAHQRAAGIADLRPPTAYD